MARFALQQRKVPFDQRILSALRAAHEMDRGNHIPDRQAWNLSLRFAQVPRLPGISICDLWHKAGLSRPTN